MLQFLAGFTLGNVVGMYLAQNYDVPNISKKIEAFKKDVEAKKKPPEWAGEGPPPCPPTDTETLHHNLFL